MDFNWKQFAYHISASAFVLLPALCALSWLMVGMPSLAGFWTAAGFDHLASQVFPAAIFLGAISAVLAVSGRSIAGRLRPESRWIAPMLASALLGVVLVVVLQLFYLGHVDFARWTSAVAVALGSVLIGTHFKIIDLLETRTDQTNG
jgi:hypothetical protein